MISMLVKLFFLFFIIIVFFVFVYGGGIYPVKDISGCYYFSTRTYVDKICLYESGSYEQFYSKDGDIFESYNSNVWREFLHSNDSGEFTIASLEGFSIINEIGQIEDRFNFDIQPYENIFGEVLFNYDSASSGDMKEYYRN